MEISRTQKEEILDIRKKMERDIIDLENVMGGLEETAYRPIQYLYHHHCPGDEEHDFLKKTAREMGLSTRIPTYVSNSLLDKYRIDIADFENMDMADFETEIVPVFSANSVDEFIRNLRRYAVWLKKRADDIYETMYTSQY